MPGLTFHTIVYRVFGLMLLLTLILAGQATPAAAHEGQHRHVLILHSHHTGQPWTEQITTTCSLIRLRAPGRLTYSASRRDHSFPQTT